MIEGHSQFARWHIYPTVDDLAARVALAIERMAADAIEDHRAFRIVLAGGSTPRLIYQRLRDIHTDWKAWYVYYGDERCLPRSSAERNSRMAEEAWLSHAPIPPAQIFPIPAELDPDEAVVLYERMISGVDQFDLVLLGLGEDGHTASLFPKHDWGDKPDSPMVLAVHDAPKPPSNRISLSAWRLSKARKVMFLVTGTSKQEAVVRWRHGEHIPAASICPLNAVDVMVDNSAFP